MKAFLARYKFYILAALIAFVLLTLFLILTSGGPQSGGFKYQIF